MSFTSWIENPVGIRCKKRARNAAPRAASEIARNPAGTRWALARRLHVAEGSCFRGGWEVFFPI